MTLRKRRGSRKPAGFVALILGGSKLSKSNKQCSAMQRHGHSLHQVGDGFLGQDCVAQIDNQLHDSRIHRITLGRDRFRKGCLDDFS